MASWLFGSLFRSGSPPGPRAEQTADTVDEMDGLGAAAAALNSLVTDLRKSGAEVPTVAYSQIAQIADFLRALVEHSRKNGCTIEQQVLLAAMSADYLPTSLKTYRTLPASKRAPNSAETMLLIEQLATLHSAAATLETEIRTGSSTELAIHGQFLQDKFDLGSLLLKGD